MQPHVPPTAPTGRAAGSFPSPSSDKPRRHSVAAAFGYAAAGLAAAWRSERNLRIEAGLALAAVALGAAVRLPLWGWAVLVAAIGLVLTAELLNAAVEAVVDLVSPHDHPLAKRAKDIAAAGVLTAAAAALGMGLLLTVWVLWGRVL